jgi:hypothetical protein
MKHLIHAVIITCIGTILISLNNKPINPPVTETVPETHTEAPQELLEPIVADIPEPIEQAIVEPVSAPQTINQAQANVTHNPVGCANYRYLVEQYDWNVNTAMAVMQAESGCNPNAENWRDNHRTCIGSKGLFQLACFWPTALGYTYDSLYDPASNVAMAYQIYKRSNSWNAWGAFTNGSYTRYL